MSLSRTVWGSQVSETSTSAQYSLGELREYNHPTYGRQILRYVLNGDAGSLTLGGVCRFKANTVSSGTVVSAVTARLPRPSIAGVAFGTIAAGSYGWIVAEGDCLVRGDGSVTKDTAIETEGTTGRAKNATVTNADEAAAIFGWAREDDGAADSTFRCKVTCL